MASSSNYSTPVEPSTIKSSHDVKRNLSSLTEEAIDVYAGKLFENIQLSKKPENDKDVELTDESFVTESELRHRKNANSEFDKNKSGDDDVISDDFVLVESQQKILQEFAEMKAKKESVEMNREFFVASLKELLRGNLGLITQSDLEKARKSGPEWDKFKEAPPFTKLTKHTGMCILELKDFIIDKVIKYSIHFIWRWIPLKEVQLVVALYVYSLLLLPEILFNFVPIVLVTLLLLTMIVYSIQITSARLDFKSYLHFVDSLGILDNIYKYNIASEYLGKTCFKYYIKFFACWFILIFLYPQVEGRIPAVFSILSFIFFVVSFISVLQIRENVVYISLAVWGCEFILWCIGVWYDDSSYKLILVPFGGVLKLIHVLILIYMACIYKWKGFMVLVCPHFFMSVWWKLFVMSVQMISLAQMANYFAICLLFLTLLPFLPILIFIAIVSSPLVVWYYYGITFAIILWSVLLISSINIAIFAFFYEKILKLELIEITFKRCIGLIFILIGAICLAIYSFNEYQISKQSALPLIDYMQFCVTDSKYENIAKWQHKCLHLQDRKIVGKGNVKSTQLDSRKNTLESVIEKIPFAPLAEGLKCLLGNRFVNETLCDISIHPEICQSEKCRLSLGEEYSYTILVSLSCYKCPVNEIKITAGTSFQNDILNFNIGDEFEFEGRLNLFGSPVASVRLSRIVRGPGSSDVVQNRDVVWNYIKRGFIFFII